MVLKRALSVALTTGVGALLCLGAVLAASLVNLEKDPAYALFTNAAEVQSLLNNPEKLNSLVSSMTVEELKEFISKLNDIIASNQLQSESYSNAIAGPDISQQLNNYPEFEAFIDPNSLEDPK
ncbi:hypothetical protein H4R35_000152 [Dimargaris xerosporica]|nr:hypothetical protein H4R35_000152 [Dimargaris xerosporica]